MPEQEASVLMGMLATSVTGVPITALVVAVQPLLSVTVTVYVAAAKFGLAALVGEFDHS